MGQYHEEQYEVLEFQTDLYYRLRIYKFSHVEKNLLTNEEEPVYIPTNEIFSVKPFEYFSFEDQGYIL